MSDETKEANPLSTPAMLAAWRAAGAFLTNPETGQIGPFEPRAQCVLVQARAAKPGGVPVAISISIEPVPIVVTQCVVESPEAAKKIAETAAAGLLAAIVSDQTEGAAQLAVIPIPLTSQPVATP